jgi:hypothetical protein
MAGEVCPEGARGWEGGCGEAFGPALNLGNAERLGSVRGRGDQGESGLIKVDKGWSDWVSYLARRLRPPAESAATAAHSKTQANSGDGHSVQGNPSKSKRIEGRRKQDPAIAPPSFRSLREEVLSARRRQRRARRPCSPSYSGARWERLGVSEAIQVNPSKSKWIKGGRGRRWRNARRLKLQSTGATPAQNVRKNSTIPGLRPPRTLSGKSDFVRPMNSSHASQRQMRSISARTSALDLPRRFCRRPRSSFSFPSASLRSSSVSCAYFCFSLPLISFQWPRRLVAVIPVNRSIRVAGCLRLSVDHFSVHLTKKILASCTHAERVCRHAQTPF